MPLFMVKCYVKGKTNKDARKVEAQDKLQAAVNVCGGPLKEGAKLENLRAVVWPLDNPNDVTSFAGT